MLVDMRALIRCLTHLGDKTAIVATHAGTHNATALPYVPWEGGKRDHLTHLCGRPSQNRPSTNPMLGVREKPYSTLQAACSKDIFKVYLWQAGDLRASIFGIYSEEEGLPCTSSLPPCQWHMQMSTSSTRQLRPQQTSRFGRSNKRCL